MRKRRSSITRLRLPTLAILMLTGCGGLSGQPLRPGSPTRPTTGDDQFLDPGDVVTLDIHRSLTRITAPAVDAAGRPLAASLFVADATGAPSDDLRMSTEPGVSAAAGVELAPGSPPTAHAGDDDQIEQAPSELRGAPPTGPLEGPSLLCTTSAQCNNHVYCDGVERCVDGECRPGVPPCAGRICVESTRSCVSCQTNEDCDDDRFCNGAEICAAGACRNGAAPCALSLCDEASDSCLPPECTAAGDCDDGGYCNGLEACVGGLCVPGTPPCLGPGIVCIELTDSCEASATILGVVVSGRVTRPAGAALGNVTLIFNGIGSSQADDFTALTGPNGEYAQEVPNNWSGTIGAPGDYRVVPASRAMLHISADAPNQDFVAFRNYHVAPGGSDATGGTLAAPLATANRALQLAQPGDTVLLRGGTYIGDGSGFSRLSPQAAGTPDAWITIRNYPGEQVVIDRNSPGSSWSFMDLRHGNAYLKISGLEIVNFAKAFNLMIDALTPPGAGPPHDIVFEDLHIHHCGSGTTSEGKAFRIRNGAHHITLNRVDIHHVAGPGVAILEDCHDISLLNVDSHDLDDGRGVDGDADGFTVDDTLIGEGAPANLWPRDITFENCRTWNATEDGFDAKGDNILFDRCQAWNVGANAFKCWAISDTRSNPQQGIARTHFVVKNCIGYNAGETCIELLHQPDVQILNSTFVARPGGAETFIIPTAKPYDPWPGRVFSRNNVFIHLGTDTGSDSPVRAMYVDTFDWQLDMDYDVFAAPNHPEHTILRRVNGAPGTYFNPAAIVGGGLFTALAIEQHGLAALPAMLNAAAGDFRLAPGDTVARDTGVNLSAQGITQDAAGQPRPQGAGFDRGAHER